MQGFLCWISLVWLLDNVTLDSVETILADEKAGEQAETAAIRNWTVEHVGTITLLTVSLIILFVKNLAAIKTVACLVLFLDLKSILLFLILIMESIITQ